LIITFILKNVRWIIQIPREYKSFFQSGKVKNYEEYLNLIFEPLFKATLDPNYDLKLSKALQHVVAFGLCSVENTFDVSTKFTHPKEWNTDAEPKYEILLYYLSTNLKYLNKLRIERGLNPILFKPNSGESVRNHLIYSYLVSNTIHNGIQLSNSPVLTFLYYLSQIGVSFSPLHINKVLLNYQDNPFPKLFKIGMNITLATNNPLNSHFTEESLLEEYSISAQIWGLSRVDLCEISKK